MKIKNNLLLILMVSVLLFSCEDDGYADYDPGQTNTEEVSGEWYIIGYDPSGEPAYGGGYNLWSTYNTAQNNDSIWLDDHGSFFELKSKVLANVADLTFEGPANAPETITGGTVSVSNGQIIKNGGRSASGAVVDSIYFEAEFDWDPGVIYTFGGHRRTGFGEDDL